MDKSDSEKQPKQYPFLNKLEEMIEASKKPNSPDNKIKKISQRGTSQIAKKMGEESVEMVIASEQGSDENFVEEAADVLFYYLMSIHARGFKLTDVIQILKKRHKKKKKTFKKHKP